MEIQPTAQISACYGGYVVQAETRCECDNPDCSGWVLTDHVFSDLNATLEFTKQVILDYESREEVSEVEAKMNVRKPK